MNDYHNFRNLFSPEIAGRSAEKIEVLCSENGEFMNRGFKIMTVFFAAALHTRKLYAKAGIDDAVYIETMGFFRRTVRENKEINGIYGLPVKSCVLQLSIES